ncbi:MAG TPA: ABC transporter permease subunit [Halanaerobiaceae bacterium]|jgi:ABC-2 type transport system permease protein|nr:ABC transporter permease subunit [Bacillota bacterium]HHU92769.1 ABC transporter permease subunit [Halanaerobiaceae bacterium]HOA40257.1 ABC transporter permease subunit [Halanaerobiales bacterium]HPZ62410.1 ABC transporter permease subunit [Halanaerobiales bacterium]HQD03808.1 ABC transporter permease subunit [Halanaerobiales bacterium]
MEKQANPFAVLVQKEISDYIYSWKFLILIGIIMLTTIGSLITILSIIKDFAANIDLENSFLFLNLFTASDGNLPPFITIIGFLGPIMGLALGFDVINVERNRGTISRVLAQPLPRDYFINSKFVAALLVIGVAIFSIGFLIMGFSILTLGIYPSLDELLRIVFFLIFTCLYIAFWLNLGILFSTIFRQSATSALAGLAVWLFYTVFYSMIVNLLANAFYNNQANINIFLSKMARLSPIGLYNELTTILLTPSIRTTGALSFEQLYGALPSTLPFSQSFLLIWPHICALLAGSFICFAISYLIFVRQEIRA